MKPFKNESTEGNEKAIRRGRVVAEGDINLAYVRSPEFSPSKNIAIVDTSRITEENIRGKRGKRLYYANPLGILVDDNNNMVINDEHPIIADVFSVDEDFSQVPGSEYSDDDILPFRHTSRYFHIDHAGLTIGGDTITYDTDAIRIVDGSGVEYPTYRIKITAAYLPGNTAEGDLWAYRVFAYVDTDKNDDLYLIYNKVELTDDGTLVRRRINHKEILNPQAYFSYTPEESEVVDPNSRDQKIYSTKPVSLKERVLNKPSPTVDGYKVYVPKKAVGDPRLYQLFRWRVRCDFVQDVKVDPGRDDMSVRCGVIVTDRDLATETPSRAPYALYNLARSRYNASEVSFINPAKENHDENEQSRREYWFVNIDHDDINQYDLLVWSPNTLNFDFTPYAGKMATFARTFGGTLLLDTNSYADPFESLGGQTSRGINPVNGGVRATGPGNNVTAAVIASSARWVEANRDHSLVDGSAQLGGWKLDENGNNPNIDVLSYTQHEVRGYSQHFHTIPTGYTPLVEAPVQGSPSTYKAVTVAREFNNGKIVFSTFGHLVSCSGVFSYIDNELLSYNLGRSVANVAQYSKHINGVAVEGAMKFLYNVALLAVKNRSIDSTNQESFSTTWSYTTPWKSSWAIKADNGVLNEKEKADHNFIIDARDIHTDPPDLTPVWKRRLANDTVKQLMDEALEPILNNPATAIRVLGSDRKYSIEVTNPYVSVSSKVVENDYPHAWTEAYSPKFVVPVELGPHIVKEETDETGRVGRVAQYDDATYVRREYPEKPYGGEVTTTYVATTEMAASLSTNYTATGTATATIEITEEIPPEYKTVPGEKVWVPGDPDVVIPGVTVEQGVPATSDVELNWWASNVSPLSAGTRGSPLQAGSRWARRTDNPYTGILSPWGVRSWQEQNYKTSSWGPGHLNWPFYGIWDRLISGSSGELVRFVQDAMNRFIDAGFFSATKLVVDGSYGPKTSTTVRAYQTRLSARYIDGVIDAETWSLIGFGIHRLAIAGKMPTSTTGHMRFYPLYNRILMHQISDGTPNSYFAKRSWRTNGPNVIWDMYAIRFNKSYKFHGVTVIPYVTGSASSIMVRSIHVTNWRSLANYDSNSGQLKNMPHRPRDNQKLYIPFGPYSGDTIILGIGQDQGSGHGTSRMFGLREVWGHTRVTTEELKTTKEPDKIIPGTDGHWEEGDPEEVMVSPGATRITYQQREITFTVNGSITTGSFSNSAIQLQPPTLTGETTHGNVVSAHNIKFTNITSSNPEVLVSMDENGLAVFRTQVVDTHSDTRIAKGQKFPSPGFTYFSMDEKGRFNPVPETGWISKADGIKLLCDKDKKPIGFPAMPSEVGPNEAHRHYLSLSLGTLGTDSSVQLGFYDIARQQFITSADGRAEMPFLEYRNRGPHNVYIGVIGDYETVSDEIIPVDDDAPRLPYRWAMPVYGVQARSGITLEPLPSKFGPTDVWPIAVREGKFYRSANVRTKREGPLTGYLRNYQGAVVHAFYDVPEARLGGFSSIYGPPNVDINNEEPLILDDDVIQVRQTPILALQKPTQFPNPADPVRPVFTLYKRATVNDPWVEEPFHKIRDFNLNTGEIYLKEHLTSNDESLLRVDYTAIRRYYSFKKHEDRFLNLNVYSGHSRDLVGESIYVYMVPHYVEDNLGNVIEASIQERTLRIALTPDVFNPLRPEYDPLAVLLGVVYLSPALDIKDLAMFDTRRRGGGLRDGANLKEVSRLVNDATSYWDLGHATGGSYQKSGYVVVRLPDELKEHISEDDLREIVGRNLTAGVGFKLEDLDGRDWS